MILCKTFAFESQEKVHRKLFCVYMAYGQTSKLICGKKRGDIAKKWQ